MKKSFLKRMYKTALPAFLVFNLLLQNVAFLIAVEAQEVDPTPEVTAEVVEPTPEVTEEFIHPTEEMTPVPTITPTEEPTTWTPDNQSLVENSKENLDRGLENMATTQEINPPIVSDIKMFVNGIETTFMRAGDTVTVQATVVDAESGIDTVRLLARSIATVDGGYIDSGYFVNTTGDTYERTFTFPADAQYIDTHKPITTDLDGLRFYIKATDNDANYTNSASTTFTYDPTVPVMDSITMYVFDGTSYVESSFVKPGDLVRIDVETTDASSGIEDVEFRIQAKVGDYVAALTHVSAPVSGDTYRFEYQVPLDAKYTNTHADMTEGINDHQFWARTTDNVGNYNHGISGEFTFDKTAPNIPTLVSPADGIVINPTGLILDWSDVTDTSGPVTYYYQSAYNSTVGANNALTTPIYNTSKTVSEINASGSADNTYYWQVQACDMLNNCSDWATPWEITVDSIAPVVTITAPADNAILAGSVNAVTGTIIDVNPLRYYLVLKDASGTVVPGALPGTISNNATSFSHNLDTTSLVDGQYFIYVAARDQALNRDNAAGSEAQITIIIDNTPPTTVLTAPLNDDIFGSAINIEGYSTDDNSLVDYVEFSYSTYNGVSCDTTYTYIGKYDVADVSPYMFDYSWTPDADGIYCIKAYATDTNGNEEASAYATGVVYDTTRPTINITTPADDAYISGAFTVEGTAGDATSGIQSIRIRFRNESDSTLISTCWATYDDVLETFTLNVNDGGSCTVPDGYYQIIGRAQDNANNSKFNNVRRITLDNIAPIITVNDLLTKDNTPALTGTVDDTTATIEITVDGQILVATNNGDGTWTLADDTLTALADGIYDVIATATDLATNIGTSDVTNVDELMVDTTRPVLAVVSPFDGEYVNTNPVTITGTVSDTLSGIDVVKMHIYDVATNTLIPGCTSLQATVTGTTWEIEVTCLSSDGEYQVAAWAYDNAGNPGWAARSNFIIDTTDPVSTLTSPLDDSYWRTPIVVEGNSTDTNSIVDTKLAYTMYDGTTCGTTYTDFYTATNSADNNPFDFYYEWIPADQGSYCIKAYATDVAGNIESSAIATNVTYDTVKPNFDITAPSDNDLLTNPFDVAGTASDATSGIQDIRIRFKQTSDDTVVATCWATYDDVLETFTLTVNDGGTCDVPDGNYKIVGRTRDNAGNKKWKNVQNVTIDNLAPIITYSSDADLSFEGELWIDMDTEDATSAVKMSYYSILGTGLTGNIADVYADGTFTCAENGLPNGAYEVSKCVSAQEYVDVSSLTSGTYTVQICAEDTVNNLGSGNMTTLPTSDPTSCYTYEVYVDNTAPTIDSLTFSQDTYYEGDTINLGVLNGKEVSDDYQLDEAYIDFTYQDPEGNDFDDITGNINTLISNLVGYPADLSGINGDGKGGTLNEWFEYETGSILDFSGINIPVDTSILPEGTYTFEYYVTDKAGNRSDCDDITDGNQNCITSLTIDNVTPTATLTSDQTILEGGVATFTGSFTDPSYISDQVYIDAVDDLMGSISNTQNLISEADDGIWEVTIDFGDGSPKENIVITNYDLAGHTMPGVLSIPPHTYDYEGVYTVTLEVCESKTNPSSEGTCDTAEVTVTVNNLVPLVTITRSSVTNTVYVGNSVTLTANPTSGNPEYTYLWSGACSGTSITANVPSTLGTYTCTVLVTDKDGDTATTSQTITVINRPAVVVEDTELTPTPTVTPEEETEGEVLGLTCNEENMRLISGTIYDDENENGVQDDGEEGIEGVTVMINVLIDGAYELAERVTTDEDGYYEALVCPGEYNVTIDENSLSDDAKILGEADQKVKINGEDQEINFNVLDESGFNWWICIIPLLILAGIMGAVYIKQRQSN